MHNLIFMKKYTYIYIYVYLYKYLYAYTVYHNTVPQKSSTPEGGARQ